MDEKFFFEAMEAAGLKVIVFDEYAACTELDWAEYEFATIEYDYKVHPDAAKRIRELFKQLYEAKP